MSRSQLLPPCSAGISARFPTAALPCFWKIFRKFCRKQKFGLTKPAVLAIISKQCFSGSFICGCAGTGRQASLRCWCRFDVWVQVPSAAPYARVVELADSLDSGSSVLYGRAGSSPASRTNKDPCRGANTPAGLFPPARVQLYIVRASGGIGRLARFRF